MEMSEEKVKYIAKLAQQPASLETPVFELNQGQLSDFLADFSVVSPLEELDESLQREEIIELLNHLREKERETLILRFGLRDGVPPDPSSDRCQPCRRGADHVVTASRAHLVGPWRKPVPLPH